MKVLSALSACNLYPPRNIPGTHFCYRLSRSQGHSAAGRVCQWIIPMTPATFRLVAQCLNQLRHRAPRILIGYNTNSRFSVTPKPNPDSEAKSRWSWLSESQYLLASIPNLSSQRFEYHVLPLRPSSTRGVLWLLDGSLRCEKSQPFWTKHLQIIHFLQFYACTICAWQLPKFIRTKVNILVPIG